MAPITHNMRLLDFQTPLGKDVLLIRSITGREGLSQLYSYEVEAFAPLATEVAFDKLIGQAVQVSVALKGGEKRYFHGLVKSVVRGARSASAIAYRLEIVPALWLLTQRTQCRVFQQVPVPDLLRKVLAGLDIDLELTGTYEPRDYCVQYRETDFAFVSRLMEEEGIYYFFRHREDGHTLVIADSPQSHEPLPCDPVLHYDEERGGVESQDEIVYVWEKQQVLRSGKVTLWDHSFELPHKPLDAQEMVDEDLQIGSVTHKLKLGGNDQLELFDFPGGYAQRFDGVSPSGGDRAADLQKIYADNERTARIRMRQETAGAIQITGHTDSLHLIPGYRFDLQRHYSDDDSYVITGCHLTIPQRGAYAADDNSEFSPPPEIVFHCLPYKLPYAPARLTPKPVIYGTQTAVVVGPAGEEIFTDAYGRVKVQFFWDREGRFDGNSSCWVRVASAWAGKQWGMIHIPRIGQEVVVAFEEGDPDQPIIVGSVYNADQMPPHSLPENKTQSGIKSRSTPNAGSQNLNEIRFEDKIGCEHIFVHAEKDLHVRSKASYFGDVGGDYNLTVHGKTNQEHFGQRSITVHANEAHWIQGSYGLGSAGDFYMKSESALGILGQSFVTLSRSDMKQEAKGDLQLEAGGTAVLSATTAVALECGGSSIVLSSSGIYINGPMVYLNSGAGQWMAVDPPTPTAENPIHPAAPLRPGESGATHNPAGPDGKASSAGEHNPNEDENKDKTHWVEVELKDESGQPVVGEPCEITLPNGKKAYGSTDKNGRIRVEKIDPGECTIRWTTLDQDAVSQ